MGKEIEGAIKDSLKVTTLSSTKTLPSGVQMRPWWCGWAAGGGASSSGEERHCVSVIKSQQGRVIGLDSARRGSKQQ